MDTSLDLSSLEAITSAVEAGAGLPEVVRAAAARSVEWMLTLNDRPSHPSTRQTAAEKLGPCLTDSSWWVRANAARALSRIGDAGVEGETHAAHIAVAGVRRSVPPRRRCRRASR